MHVGIDARIADYTAGGIAQYTRQLAVWLPRLAPTARFTLFRACRRRVSWTPPTTPRQRRLLTPAHHRWEQVLLPLELATERLDLLHGPDFTVPMRRRCPAVVTVHDLAFLRYPEIQTADSRRHYRQVARIVQHVERVIVDSACTGADVQALLGVPPARIRVVHLAPTPAPLPDAAQVAAVRARYALDGPFLLYVGTLEPRKNRAPCSGPSLAWGRPSRPGPCWPARAAGSTSRSLPPPRVSASACAWSVPCLPRPPCALRRRYGVRLPVPLRGLWPAPAGGHGRRARRIAPEASCLPEVLGDAALFVPPERSGATSCTDDPTPPRRNWRPPRGRRTSTTGSSSCRRATTPSSASVGTSSRAARSSVWRSRASS